MAQRAWSRGPGGGRIAGAPRAPFSKLRPVRTENATSGVPVHEPRTPKGRRTRLAVLDAARVVFAREGYVATRMTDVAAEADISLGGLYRYFGNKDELFEALIAGLHEQLYAASAPGTKRFPVAPGEALLAANRAYLAVFAEHQDVMRAFMEAGNVNARVRRFWWRMRDRHAERIATALRDVQGIHEIAGSDPLLAAEALACMVEQTAFVWYAHGRSQGDAPDVDEAARVLTRLWTRGVFGDSAGAP